MDMGKWDRDVAAVRDTIPSALYSFYAQCLTEGFNQNQAMELTIMLMSRFMAGSMDNRSTEDPPDSL